MNELKDKVAVITGGTRGLGLAIAEAFGKEGATVVVASRSKDSVHSAIEQLSNHGITASGMSVDVSQFEQVKALVNHAIEEFGHLDIWVNNAGLSCPTGPTMHVPDERIRALINTNIIGVYNGSRAAMETFVPQGFGKLINISGKGERKPFPMHNPYASSKAWEHNFTLTLAKEYKYSGVGVFLINPGLVESDMFRHLSFVRGYEENIEIFKVVARLFSNPPEVAAAKVVWLASSATDGKTGIRINLIGTAGMLKGVSRELSRRMRRHPAPPLEVEVSLVEPSMDVDITDPSKHTPGERSQKYIFPLTQKDLPETVGRKARNLNLLIKEGYRVPPGFVCTWEAFQQYTNGDQGVLERIKQELAGYIDPQLTYAVRSSANVEDSLTHSFAGQFSTVLEVKGVEQVLNSIIAVWEAVGSDSIQAYLNRIEIDSSDLKIAVIIQEMISPQVSGVSFSINPMTALDEVVVEAVEGIGTALVQGGKTPMRWVNKWDGWVSVPDNSAVSLDLIQGVVDQTHKIAKDFKREVDLEWVFDGEDLYWLQMRDITALIDSSRIYSNRMAKEMTPGMVQPLVWSVTVPIPSKVWVSLLSEVLGKNDLKPELLMKPFHFRAYHNMGIFGQVFEILGLPRESLEMMSGIVPPGAGKPHFRPGPKTLLRFPRMIGFLLNKWRFAKKATVDYPRFFEMTYKYPLVPPKELQGEDIITEIDNIIALNTETTYNTIVVILLMQIYNGTFKSLLTRAGYEFQQFDLTEGMEELKQFDPNVKLAKLNRIYRKLDEQVRESIQIQGWNGLAKINGAEAFRTELDEFFQAFGHMSDSTGHFGNKPWRETPDLILDIIVDFNLSEETPGTKICYRDLEVGGMKGMLWRTLYQRARQFRLFREMYSSLFTYQLMLLRSYYLALGDRFVWDGVLKDAEDILFLYDNEVRGYYSGAETGIDFNQRVKKRLEDWENCKDSMLPEVIFGDTVPPVVPLAREKLVGTPTSRGYFTGKVKIVRAIGEFHKLSHGDVLVIPYSDVSWTPLFAKAGAVIAESGGILSHSSIIAREYSIPAVVSVPGALGLQDETWVTIDGFKGEILVHDTDHVTLGS